MARSLFRDARWVVTTFPTTIIVVAAIFVIAIHTSGDTHHEYRELLRQIGLTFNKLLNGEIWGMPASTLVQSSPGIGWPLAFTVAVSLGALEYLTGSLRALVTFFLSDWISAPLTLGAEWMLAELGSRHALFWLHHVDTGSSAAAVGTLAAVLALLPRRLRVVGLTLMFAVLLYRTPGADLAANLAHLFGAAVGATMGLLVWRRPRRRLPHLRHLAPNRAAEPAADSVSQFVPNGEERAVAPTRASHERHPSGRAGP